MQFHILVAWLVTENKHLVVIQFLISKQSKTIIITIKLPANDNEHLNKLLCIAKSLWIKVCPVSMSTGSEMTKDGRKKFFR